ncbi:MAG TPA: 3-phosphoshikimate 1-carboxyvinyltransferase [Candidatus Binatia bacterium]|nr:3-phosphoshikimate 1-carboxyvinyltransferase [Candidatus Binatia bacterium]
MKRIGPHKQPVRGEIAVPGDKSIAHRAVIFAAIAQGRSQIFNLSGGDDNSRTVRAFRQMGVEIFREGDALCIEGKGWEGLRPPAETIDCGNSGTTMRLMSGLLAGRPFHSELDGDSSLRQRPMKRVIDPLSAMGARIRSRRSDGLAPLEIDGGGLRGIEYRMPMASAQVKSAILLAGLQADGQTVIHEPQKSRDHTEVMLAGFGGKIAADGLAIVLDGRPVLTGQGVRIPGDISSAAFFLAAAAMIPGSELVVRNVGCNQTRDGVIEVLQRMGAAIELDRHRLEAGERVADIHVTGGTLKGVDVGPDLVARTIDEYPILAVAAAVAEGTTTFSGVKELRFKESDRIAAMTEGLRALGVSVEEREDGMTIHGGQGIRGGAVKSYADHRIAMSFAIAGLLSARGVEIDDPRCVDISFPSFFDLLAEICLH